MKFEGSNHIIKNYGKRLYKIKSDTKAIPLQARKLLSNDLIKNLQSIVKETVFHNATHGDVNQLMLDLENGPNHLLGEHSKCHRYYCEQIGSM